MVVHLDPPTPVSTDEGCPSRPCWGVSEICVPDGLPETVVFYGPSPVFSFPVQQFAMQIVAVSIFWSTSTTSRPVLLRAHEFKQICSTKTDAQRR